jgi:hypothetical protein
MSWPVIIAAAVYSKTHTHKCSALINIGEAGVLCCLYSTSIYIYVQTKNTNYPDFLMLGCILCIVILYLVCSLVLVFLYTRNAAGQPTGPVDPCTMQQQQDGKTSYSKLTHILMYMHAYTYILKKMYVFLQAGDPK